MSSLTAEEIQKSLVDSMMSMQQQMDQERESFKKNIQNLEKLNKEYKEKIDELTETLSSKKDEDTGVNKIIANLNADIRKKEKEIEEIKIKRQQDAVEISNLNNQLQLKNETILDLESEKKKLSIRQNEILVMEKKLEALKEEKIELAKKNEEKDAIIGELNEKISKVEKNYRELLKKIKEINEKEEQLKKEKEELVLEKEKMKQELIKIQKNNEIKQEKQKEKEKVIEKEKTETINKEDSNNKNILEEQNKIIKDILCDFLLKLNNSQYYISIFDLLNKSCTQYEELKFFNKINTTLHESMNDSLFNFFDSVRSYFSIAQEKATLKDFLVQKSFKLTELEKEDIDLIKKINSIKLGGNVKLLDLFKKKRELFFKSKEFTFNLLKDKILIDQENDKFIKNYGKQNLIDNSHFEFLNIVTPPLELKVNFDELLKQDYALVKYQVHNVFSKLKELTLSISKFPIFLLYSLSVNCQSLNTLRIEFIKDEDEEKHKKNIEILNEIYPKLIAYLKKLTTFSLHNLPLQQIHLPDLSAALKNSKIKKLSLINCFQSKEDIMQLIPYFSLFNSLLEIDLSNHNNYNFPTFLNTSLLNYNISKKLTSINFSNSNLDDQDIKHISNYMVASTSLLSCDIGKNILSPLACSTFGYSILKSTSLQTLKINECGINGESLLFIFNGKGSKSLKHINLNGNEFGDIGLISLSAFMKSSPLLESIELEKCGGTDMGFNSLVNILKSNENSKMKYVNFHKNSITKVSFDILKKFNDDFQKKKIVFALDKIEGEKDTIEAINCAVFT